MHVMGLLILLLLAHLTPATAAVRRYHMVTVLKNWNDAQSYCREKFFDLATIESSEDQSRVEELLTLYGYNRAWIGVYDDVNSWRWSMNDTLLYKDGNTDLGSWFVFQIDNYGSRENCGSMTNGVLYDKNCLDARKFVCYDEASNTYIPVTTTMAWPAAQTYCRETYTDLASMRTEQEKQDLMSATDQQSSWWVGLSRDSWAWSDQTPFTFDAWEAPDPNSGAENCGILKVGGWYDIPCGMSYHFVCQGFRKADYRPNCLPSCFCKKRHTNCTCTQYSNCFTSDKLSNVLKVAVKTDGAVDLNDPFVRDALLEEIKKRTGNLTMTWMKYSDGKVFNMAESED